MTDPAQLVEAARRGDQAAWDALVDRYSGLVYSVARRLCPADAYDISQTTWLRLVEHLGRLDEPEHVGAWLATTAKYESFRMLRRAKREQLTGDAADLDIADQSNPARTRSGHARPGDPSPDAGLLRSERDAALWRALKTLSEPCQQLLRTLMADPPPSYAEVSAALGLPVGSIGPTRGRCLEQLRQRVSMAGITGEPSGSFSKEGPA